MVRRYGLQSELWIRGSKRYFSIEILKISTEIEVEGVKILK